MSPIQWRDDLAVGVDAIDSQHKEIFRIAGLFLSAAEGSDSDEKATDTLTFLNEYVATHFRDEEALMREKEYPHLEDHISEHQYFRNQLSVIAKQFSGSDDERKRAIQSLYVILSNWLVEHIQMTDRTLAKFLNA